MQDNIQTLLSKLSIQIIFLSLLHKKSSRISIQPISTPAKRPKYSVLDKTKIKSTLGIQIKSWKERLKA
ncbi:sugar nucleotide-binding protein [Flavobacterium sp.]|uniref:sugar nucleotide-binding protein n=1 Tax=Flavobacterium sp. TaxID=239 RepID=UPI0037C162F1